MRRGGRHARGDGRQYARCARLSSAGLCADGLPLPPPGTWTALVDVAIPAGVLGAAR